jgi:hypothetical protein
MATNVVLAIGTRKGLFLAHSADRSAWDITGPHLPMQEVYAIGIDARTRTEGRPPRLLVGASSSHWGPSVATSDDLGETWDEPETAPISFPEDTDASLERVWQLVPGPAGQPEVVYAGVEPTALFRSSDSGKTFDLVRGLWDHPHHKDWGPGAGGAAIHTVLPHPSGKRVTIAMSTGGVYVSDDDCATWEARNTGIRAVHVPEDQQYPEFGQCVHKVTVHPDRPEQLFTQVHHGVYRSDDGGSSWASIADGLPADFGFAIVAHPHRPGVIYNFPLEADMRRYPPDGKARVYRSEDAGKTWTALSNGLPEQFYVSVLRDALACDDADPAGVYFGTRSGEVYGSADEGDSWQQIVAHLPDVVCVRAARAN